MFHRSTSLLSCASLALFAGTSLAKAADPVSKPVESALLPAVDGLNGKISGFGGWNDLGARSLPAIPGVNRNAGVFGGAASITVPLTHSFGFQLDGAAASTRGTSTLSAGAHAFWRDPSRGLIGAYGSTSRLDAVGGISIHRAALEADAYFGRFTLGGLAGWEGGNTRNFVGGQIKIKDRFFDDIKLSYYATDNWRVSVGHTYLSGRHAATLGSEYMVGISGGTAAALFAEARLGERGNRAAIGGLTLYFGQKDKTLIRRHREDDPPNYSFYHLLWLAIEQQRLGFPPPCFCGCL